MSPHPPPPPPARPRAGTPPPQTALPFGDERLNAVMDEFGERRSSQG